MTKTATTPTLRAIVFPKVGDLVLVEQYRYASGNSSVPFAEPITDGDMLGTLEAVDADTYIVRNDAGAVLATITSVYDVVEDDLFGGRLFIRGWIDGRWALWIASN